jgi:parvulin-like peptidyl-prolyl isomerase
MALQIQIGEHQIKEEQIFPLLAQYQLFSDLAKEILIDQAIAKDPDLSCNEEEVKIAVNQFVQKQQFKSEAEFDDWLQQNGLRRSQLAAIASRPLRIEKFKQKQWGDNLEVYFVERKSQLDRIIYSLIRTHDPGIAQELYFRILDDGSTFSDLARKYSQGAEAQTGGLIGPVEMSIPHPQMTQILATATPGEVKTPVKIGDWFVLLRLEKVIPAQLDEAMRQRLINEQFEAWLQQQIKEQVVINFVEATEADFIN